eukprot:scaffold26443_cov152-Cylindrotheca_fusiformis.AAC.2
MSPNAARKSLACDIENMTDEAETDKPQNRSQNHQNQDESWYPLTKYSPASNGHAIRHPSNRHQHYVATSYHSKLILYRGANSQLMDIHQACQYDKEQPFRNNNAAPRANTPEQQKPVQDRGSQNPSQLPQRGSIGTRSVEVVYATATTATTTTTRSFG